MAYRSLKRVFDETSLERKCRIFFAVSLALLITVAFGWVEFNAERMVNVRPTEALPRIRFPLTGPPSQ